MLALVDELHDAAGNETRDLHHAEALAVGPLQREGLALVVERGLVDGAELPLLERMGFALFETAALLALADGEPELDQVHPAAHQVALEAIGKLDGDLNRLAKRRQLLWILFGWRPLNLRWWRD